jgi:hypothetical protein
MRAGGSASPEAHTQARSVIHFLLLFRIAAVHSFEAQIALVKTLFERVVMPMKKPFSSIYPYWKCCARQRRLAHHLMQHVKVQLISISKVSLVAVAIDSGAPFDSKLVGMAM